jgi:hypothetical protein
VVAVVACLALAGTALAATLKVTGGAVTVTPSTAAASLLSSNGITVTPVAPATASAGVFTFPVAGGRLHAKTLHGVIREQGGLDIANGTTTVQVRHMRLISDKAGVSLLAVVHHHAARIARVTDVSVSNGAATGTVHISAVTAAVINRLAGKQVVSAGAVLGMATVTPTF